MQKNINCLKYYQLYANKYNFIKLLIMNELNSSSTFPYKNVHNFHSNIFVFIKKLFIFAEHLKLNNMKIYRFHVSRNIGGIIRKQSNHSIEVIIKSDTKKDCILLAQTILNSPYLNNYYFSNYTHDISNIDNEHIINITKNHKKCILLAYLNSGNPVNYEDYFLYWDDIYSFSTNLNDDFEKHLKLSDERFKNHAEQSKLAEIKKQDDFQLILDVESIEGISFTIENKTTTKSFKKIIKDVKDITEIKDMFSTYLEWREHWSRYLEYYINFENKIKDILDAQEAEHDIDDGHFCYTLRENFAQFTKDKSIHGYSDNHIASDKIKKAYYEKFGENTLDFDAEMSQLYVYTDNREEAEQFLLWSYLTYIKPTLNSIK